MHKQKFFIAPILILICVLLFACRETTNTDKDNKENNDISENIINTVTAATTEDYILNLPQPDMNGKEMNILTSNWFTYTPLDFVDIAPESYNGDLISDAAFERKLKIEQRYNIEIKDINMDLNDAVNKLRASIMAADEAYDIAFMRGVNISGLLSNNYLLDLSQLPHIDFEMPWWKKDAVKAFSIKGRQFGAAGSMSTNEMMLIWGTCFNKNFIKDYGLENPYNLVKSGDWTFDTLIEMSKSVYKDLDGDSNMDAKDMYGINYTYETVMGLLNSAEIRVAELDNQGIPQIKIDDQISVSRMQDIFEKLFDQPFAGEILTHLNLWDKDGEIFCDNRCLFFLTGFHTVDALRATDVDFGIIPYPKYSKAQTYHYSYCLGPNIPWIVVPATNTEIENTAVFMEAFAYEGYKNLVPVFYDKILMGKLARDDESMEMIEWMYKNLRYDTGYLFDFGGFISGTIYGMGQRYDTNVASMLEKNLPILQKGIDNMITQFEAEK